MSVQFVDNTGEFKDAKDRAVMQALEMIGLKAEGYAKGLCPVDTGLLRNSITHALAGQTTAISSYHASKGSNRNSKGNRISASAKGAGMVGYGAYSGTVGDRDEAAVYIGTNVEYAPYIEYGTKKHKAQPFIRPSASNHTDEYKNILKKCLRGA